MHSGAHRQPTRARSWTLLATVIGLTLAPACGCNKTASVYPVNGKVQWKGGGPATELVNHGISLESADRLSSGMGTVQPDGSFTISTLAENDGAVPGKHRVAITPPEPEIDKPAPKRLIPARYSSFETSGLEIEIKPEPNNSITLELDRR